MPRPPQEEKSKRKNVLARSARFAGESEKRFDSDFVEPVLLLSAHRAPPHSRSEVLRAFVFGTDGSVLLTPRINAFVATCYVFSPIASRLMGRTPGTHVLALLVCP
jgi:hypothetical protein